MPRRYLAHLLLVCAVLLGGWQAQAQERAFNPGLEMMLFYKNPSSELAARIFDAIASDPRSNRDNVQGAIVGFAAVMFQKYPERIDRFLPEQPSAQLMASLATALRLAGQHDRALDYVTPVTGKARLKDFINRLPASFDAIEARGAYDFDLLWGATFASGDAAYCRKILDRYTALANTGDNADHILTFARSQQTQEDTKGLVAQLGREKSIELVHVASALWSLKSNARAHAFVGEMLAQYLAANPDTPATKALLSL
jgi:hypothetical protein